MGVLTMTEYINREAIRDALYDVDAITMEGVKILNQFPPSDVSTVQHGHWIMKKTSAGASYTVCSHCNTSVKYNDEYGAVIMNLNGANYCPNCGTKMDEVSG